MSRSKSTCVQGRGFDERDTSMSPRVIVVNETMARRYWQGQDPVGKTVHFHLHDGHPVIPGLSDHFSFLTQIAVPFEHRGRRSLDPMYGPGGLAAIVAAMIEALGGERASLTLEIHQSEGRLPVGDAAPLFRHWRDLKNAERMNYWLSVLTQNNVLLSNVIEPRPGR